jgi:hypothetical protein
MAPEDLTLISTDRFKITSPKMKTKNQTQDERYRSSDQSDHVFLNPPPGPMPKFVTTEGTIVEKFGSKAGKALKD